MSDNRLTASEVDIKRLVARVEKLEDAVFGGAHTTSAHRRRAHAATGLKTDVALDFSMPMRAFVKRHGKGLSGPKAFSLLVAYLTKGYTNKRISIPEVEKRWNKLTSLLGMKFNPAHPSRARENDWVNTEKAGLYHLRPGWKKILS